jgi:hypothetical protein
MFTTGANFFAGDLAPDQHESFSMSDPRSSAE